MADITINITGNFNNPMTALGDIIVGGASGTPTRKAIGSSLQYLRVNAAGNDLEYATFPTIPTVTPSALTRTNDTNVTITLGGTPTTALLQTVSLTVGWSGTLADARITSASTWNAKIGGSGTTGTIAKFTASGTIGNSIITENSTIIGIAGNLFLTATTGRNIQGLGVLNQRLLMEGTDFSSSLIVNVRNSNDASGAILALGKSRGTTVGSNTIVQDGDTLGGVDGVGTDGTGAVYRAGRISFEVDGTPGSADMPGRFVIWTSPDGSSNIMKRVTVTQGGLVLINQTTSTGEQLQLTGTSKFVGNMGLTGNLTLTTAGNGLLIKEGTNATMGTATLVLGTVTIATTKVTANSRVFFSRKSNVSSVGVIAESARVNGTSFTLTSYQANTNIPDTSDTSIVSWIIIEPTP